MRYLILLLLPVMAMADTPSRDFDLLVETGSFFRVYGHGGDGTKGVPVAAGFDCDGDSLHDFAYAGVQTTPIAGRTNAGEVVFLFGDGSLVGETNTIGFSPDILKIAGDQPWEVAGAEIWMDDVNDDGLGDLMIGRQNYSPDTNRIGAGALTIIFGSGEWRTEAAKLQHVDLRSMPTNLTYITFVGSNAYDRLGIWMRSGDVDGDGVADIVVGADQVDGPGASNRGAGYVIRGGSHLTWTNFIDLAHYDTSVLAGHIARIDPPEGALDYHVGGTCQIADLDGNGRAEVILGAALNRASAGIGPYGTSATGAKGAPRGITYIAWDDWFPTNLWPADYQFTITNMPGSYTAIQGDIFNRSFGEELVGGIDYDGDGKAELFIGDLAADGIDDDLPFSGSGHVFYNASMLKGLDFTLAAPPPGIRFTVIEGPHTFAIGADTVTQGDFDGDGLGDLAFGNPHHSYKTRYNAGSMHVIYGQPGGWPDEIRLNPIDMPGDDVVRIVEIGGAHGRIGGDEGDTLCYSVASGDVDMDGITDIIVNEMAGNGLTTNGAGTVVTAEDVGNILVISGKAILGLPNRITEIVPTGPGDVAVRFFSNSNETYHVEAALDLNGQVWTNITGSIPGSGTQSVAVVSGPGQTYEAFRVRKEQHD